MKKKQETVEAWWDIEIHAFAIHAERAIGKG